MKPIPVILFAYARPRYVSRALACLKEDCVPLIYAYADGAKGMSDAKAVEETRAILRAVDWCELRIVERSENVGLGRNVLSGVTEVARNHEAFIVWEDDLICVPGTYSWLCAALRHYASDPRVMSVTGWTHPRATPSDVISSPYFDGRAECWVWGAYARSWVGMDQIALDKMAACVAQGLRADFYGADLPYMARTELARNIWAVRWLYHHMQNGGLCIRPPWSMAEHEGYDLSATNAVTAEGWTNSSLRPVPPIPNRWPEPRLHPDCARLWRRGFPNTWRRRLMTLRYRFRRFLSV